LKDLDHVRDLLDAAIDEGESIAKHLIEVSVLIEAGRDNAANERMAEGHDRMWFLDAKCRRLQLRRGLNDPLVVFLDEYRRCLWAFYQYLKAHYAPDSGYDEDLSNEKMNAAEAAHLALIDAAAAIVGTQDPAP
jgi:hypothetical protein